MKMCGAWAAKLDRQIVLVRISIVVKRYCDHENSFKEKHLTGDDL